MKYDYIIVGAGVAGLYAALNIPENKKVLILSKDPLWECNTFYAQGGISTAKDEYDIPVHIEDTLKAGAGLCDKKAVEILSRNSINVINDLIERGFEFDKDENGNLLFTREAAHSTARILHAGGDATGRKLHLFLMQNIKHKVLEGAVVTDILCEDGIVYGVTIRFKGILQNIYANYVFLTSGGIGSLYEYHTNAKTISADIQGIALEKGIELKDMEFTQFHPTVFIKSKKARKLLLTEALRGEGATVVDENGKRFLFDFDDRGELAPRDIVSRAIYRYKQEGHQVYLSFENFEESFFKHRFPTIYKNFQELGFDVPKQKVPISPAFHFMMGGIKTDYYAKVKNFENLYAIGEVACSGVHGANRLASNSLLEGLVFSKRAVEDTLINEKEYKNKEFLINRAPLVKNIDKKMKNLLRKTMWDKVGIIRKTKDLKEAADIIEDIEKKDIGRFLKLRVLSAKEIVKSAINRKKSVGAHYIEE
ncbi:L-aspartate oxidase [Nitrosophilus kaiyonis]|uniref:L-aspartate oxidase n=1 Tax=Nitrosophilus kaiyonis TaxID=2930200 RepID=UPI00249268C0|nr:L-aspartate oxidase [Nitrosophilus kaiyonis]